MQVLNFLFTLVPYFGLLGLNKCSKKMLMTVCTKILEFGLFLGEVMAIFMNKTKYFRLCLTDLRLT